MTAPHSPKPAKPDPYDSVEVDVDLDSFLTENALVLDPDSTIPPPWTPPPPANKAPSPPPAKPPSPAAAPPPAKPLSELLASAKASASPSAAPAKSLSELLAAAPRAQAPQTPPANPIAPLKATPPAEPSPYDSLSVDTDLGSFLSAKFEPPSAPPAAAPAPPPPAPPPADGSFDFTLDLSFDQSSEPGLPTLDLPPPEDLSAEKTSPYAAAPAPAAPPAEPSAGPDYSATRLWRELGELGLSAAFPHATFKDYHRVFTRIDSAWATPAYNDVIHELTFKESNQAGFPSAVVSEIANLVNAWDEAKSVIFPHRQAEFNREMAPQGYTVTFQSVLKAIDAGRLDIVEKLRLAGFNLAAPDAQGRTALGHAAFIGNSKILTHLFQLGVPCDIRDPEGFLPLHWACLGKNNDACCLLLIKHATTAHINAVNKMKQTPLHCAAHSGRKWLISLLLDKGAQPHINDFDSRKQSALDVAIARKHEGAIELLKARGGFTFKFLNTP